MVAAEHVQGMSTPAFHPYRSAEAREIYLTYYDSLAARQWPVTSEERMAPTSYGETFVRITGPPAAPPLVLFPGAFTTSLMWAPNIRMLSDAFRTYAVDQIGDSGRSTCTRPVRSWEDLLGWMSDLFRALELTHGINLAGMSFGGSLAAQYALHYPERVAKVVLLAPGGTVLRFSTVFMARLMFTAMSTRQRLPAVVRWLFADMARKDPLWIDETVELLSMNMRSLQKRQLPMPKVFTDAEWQRLKVPALFLAGEHETIYSPTKAVRRLKRVAPQVKTEIISGAGHDLTFAQAELVSRRVIDFLR